MVEKVGRNDPCPCGSGKKYKQCCWGKPVLAKRKIKAVMLNKPKATNLMERTFGEALDHQKEDESLLAQTAFPVTSDPPEGDVCPIEIPPPEKE